MSFLKVELLTCIFRMLCYDPDAPKVTRREHKGQAHPFKWLKKKKFLFLRTVYKYSRTIKVFSATKHDKLLSRGRKTCFPRDQNRSETTQQVRKQRCFIRSLQSSDKVYLLLCSQKISLHKHHQLTNCTKSHKLIKLIFS